MESNCSIAQLEVIPVVGIAVMPPPIAPRILSRIYVTESGDVVVTDLWEDLEKHLVGEKGFSKS